MGLGLGITLLIFMMLKTKVHPFLAMMSFMPIFVPIILILMKTVTTQMGLTGGVIEVINFLGAPVIAVGIGLIIAIYGLGKDQDKKAITTTMEKGIKSAVVIPFAISSIVRLIQGSVTVAMTTAASVTAPMLATLGLSLELAVLSACMGSLVFSHFNDSYFWVVNRTLGVTEVKEQLRGYSIASTIVWAVGFVELIILNLLYNI